MGQSNFESDDFDALYKIIKIEIFFFFIFFDYKSVCVKFFIKLYNKLSERKNIEISVQFSYRLVY